MKKLSMMCARVIYIGLVHHPKGSFAKCFVKNLGRLHISFLSKALGFCLCAYYLISTRLSPSSLYITVLQQGNIKLCQPNGSAFAGDFSAKLPGG